VPGTLHQGLLLLFQDDPWLTFDLLGLERPITAGVPIDRRGEVERDGREPMTVRQGFPDLVLVHRDAADETRGVVITVEVQKDPDPDKRWMIPVYQSHLAEEHRLDTYAVVVSLNRRVSRLILAWRDGGPPRVDVLLHDIDTISISWLDNPAHRPLAAVLVGALHGFAGDLDAARVGFHAARSIAGRRRVRHGMTVLAALPQHLREQLIGELPVQEQHDWMDIERRSGTYQFGRREGVEAGREEARSIVRELIFGCLEERGLAVDEASTAAINQCSDLPTLQRWARRAVTVASAGALFDP
jgi:hypothetical protein